LPSVLQNTLGKKSIHVKGKKNTLGKENTLGQVPCTVKKEKTANVTPFDGNLDSLTLCQVPMNETGKIIFLPSVSSMAHGKDPLCLVFLDGTRQRPSLTRLFARMGATRHQLGNAHL
jgi:hypothetical protein